MKKTFLSSLFLSLAVMHAAGQVARFTVDGVDLRVYQDAAIALPPAAFPNAGLVGAAAAKDGALRSSCNVFLVSDKDSRVLIDVGSGAPNGSLAELLRKDGVDPASVTDILVTHEHADHIGGLMGADGMPVFKNATLHMWWPASQAGVPKFQFVMGHNGYRLDLFNDPAVKLPAGFTVETAAGHSPHHVFYRKGRLLFVGAAFHAIDIQFDHPDICAVWDADRAAATDVRRALLKRAAEAGGGLVICGTHIPFPGAGFFAAGSAKAASWRFLEPAK